MPESQPESQLQVDLTNCDREPIQFPGQVQHHGCLIAVSTDWIVTHASTNTEEMLGLSQPDILGTRFSDLFDPEATHMMRTRLQMLGRDEGATRSFDLALFGDERQFDVSMHLTDRTYIFEFEPKQRRLGPDIGQVQPLLRRIQRHQEEAAMSREAVRIVKAITGFDRVMMYKFEPDQSGTVIAEACESDMEPYLGLRYPASDIPKQARALYKRSMLRLIADVDGPVFDVLPKTSPEGEPLDMSLCVTRAVSPIHLEYLRNMGVKASMSVSILNRGELWGLFACHHNTPIAIDFERRSVTELFGQLFAYHLTECQAGREREEAARGQILHDRLMARVSSDANLHTNFEAIADEMAEAIAFDGFALLSDGQYMARGLAPTAEECVPLAKFLNTTASDTVFATDNLGQSYPEIDAISDRVAGVMALPISRRPRDYILMFRQEIARSVRWAGNPEKPVRVGQHGARLTPRESFAAWTEVVKGRSAPWNPREFAAADAMRVTLTEVVLKVADAANAQRKAMNERQELLIAELNHRVRNILNLIRGLVSRSQYDAATIEEFTKILDGRIHALARAHDLLTESEWDQTSVTALLNVEIEGFTGGRADQVRISGDDVALDAAAFSTLALVVHELTTNAAKYGALSHGDGRVDIAMEWDDHKDLVLTWAEHNVPDVREPKRRGFGTTIIERSIDFELKGQSTLEFLPGGIRATLTIPKHHVSRPATADTPDTVTNVVPITAKEELKLAGHALLVEDNMIIAMDAEDMLHDLGLDQVSIAARVIDALRVLESETITMAVLDVNLGTETSEVIAQKLAARDIPFILASGYGADQEIARAFPGAPVLKKPYTARSLRAAIEQLILPGGA